MHYILQIIHVIHAKMYFYGIRSRLYYLSVTKMDEITCLMLYMYFYVQKVNQILEQECKRNYVNQPVPTIFVAFILDDPVVNVFSIYIILNSNTFFITIYSIVVYEFSKTWPNVVVNYSFLSIYFPNFTLNIVNMIGIKSQLQ